MIEYISKDKSVYQIGSKVISKNEGTRSYDKINTFFLFQPLKYQAEYIRCIDPTIILNLKLFQREKIMEVSLFFLSSRRKRTFRKIFSPT